MGYFKIFTLLVCSLVLVCSAESRYIGGYFPAGSSVKVKDLDPKLLTHLYYAFVVANPDGSLTVEQEKTNKARELLTLKKLNPDLKLFFTLVTNSNNSLSTVCANQDLRSKLVENALQLIKNYTYDGIDIDWEFPKPQDKEGFTNLLAELHETLHKNGFGLTAALAAIPRAGYDIAKMIKYLDTFNVMTYDYYGAWSNTTGEVSPLYSYHNYTAYEKKYLSVNATLYNYIAAGVPRNRIAIGIPFYGRTFNLTDPAHHGVYDPSSGHGTPVSPSYFQILRDFQKYTREWNQEQLCPYKYSGSNWLGYDDEESVGYKVDYANKQKIHGVFVWQIAGDDIYGNFSKTPQPLLRKIDETLLQDCGEC